MALCMKCNRENIEDGQFCTHCGTALAVTLSITTGTDRTLPNTSSKSAIVRLICGISLALLGTVLFIIESGMRPEEFVPHHGWVNNVDTIRTLRIFGSISVIVGIILAISYGLSRKTAITRLICGISSALIGVILFIIASGLRPEEWIPHQGWINNTETITTLQVLGVISLIIGFILAISYGLSYKKGK